MLVPGVSIDMSAMTDNDHNKTAKTSKISDPLDSPMLM